MVLQGNGLTLDVGITGNQVTSATINAAGTNYKVGDTLSVAIADVGSTGAGVIDTLTVTNSGGYSFTDGVYPGVALTGGNGSNATAEVTVNGNTIDVVTITNRGTGYQVGDVLGLTGYAGAQVTVGALIVPSGFEYTISGITVGSGVTLTPSTLITGSGAALNVATISTGTGGSNATANITVSGGAVTEVAISDAGTGYSIGDTIRVNDADMEYDDGAGNIVLSSTPTTQMLLTIDKLGEVSIATITEEGEGYKAGDEMTAPNSELGGTGSGFKLTASTIVSETTASIDEKTGTLTVKVFNSDLLTIGSSLNLTEAGISKLTAGNLLLSTTTDSFVQMGGNQATMIPTGTSAQRPVGQEGMIRYNSEERQFEGYNGISFVSLGAVRDVDLDTFVTAEGSTALDDDTFRFFQ